LCIYLLSDAYNDEKFSPQEAGDSTPGDSMKKIQLLVIGDSRLLRGGLVAMLKKCPELKVVDAIGANEKMFQKIRELKPDVVLLDFGLRNRNSLRFVKSLKKNPDEMKIIAMNLIPAQEDVLEFVRAGVSGFILKDAKIRDFLRTIRSVAQGEKVLPSSLAGSLFSQIVEHEVYGMRWASSKLMESVRMTRRERQVIELIADGLSNKDTAQILCLSTSTVKRHVHNILARLHLHTRVQIAKRAQSSKDFTSTETLFR
jgi:DNA-binding NarL/FixJ family response regulator